MKISVWTTTDVEASKDAATCNCGSSCGGGGGGGGCSNCGGSNRCRAAGMTARVESDDSNELKAPLA